MEPNENTERAKMISDMATGVANQLITGHLRDVLNRGDKEEKFLALAEAVKKLQDIYFKSILDFYSPNYSIKVIPRERTVGKLENLIEYMACFYDDCLEKYGLPSSWVHEAVVIKLVIQDPNLETGLWMLKVESEILSYLHDEVKNPFLSNLDQDLKKQSLGENKKHVDRHNPAVCAALSLEAQKIIKPYLASRPKAAPSEQDLAKYTP